MATSQTVTVKFLSSAKAEYVKPLALTVIKEICAAAGISSCTITSTARTPADQARAMYNNIVATSPEKQKALYAAAGDSVIDVYVAEKAKGKNATQIKAAMEAKIIAIGPAKVSRHCADFNVLCVVDIAPSSIADKKKFEAAVRADKRVKKFLLPPEDPAYHLEIPVV